MTNLMDEDALDRMLDETTVSRLHCPARGPRPPLPLDVSTVLLEERAFSRATAAPSAKAEAHEHPRCQIPASPVTAQQRTIRACRSRKQARHVRICLIRGKSSGRS